MDLFCNANNLSRESLRAILKDFDPIPDTHRITVWTALLQLPHNKSEYVQLRKAGKSLTQNVDHGDDIQRKTACRIVGSLNAHCPSLRQFKAFNLAHFVEPFSPLLFTHELLYFEVVFSILVNYCQHWFDHIPSPPYSLMTMMDIILLKVEPGLYKHLASRGIRAIDYAWRWMSSAFSMIVDPAEYYNLWDHILSNEPGFIYFIPIAACKLQSRSLLKLSTHGEIMESLHSSIPLDYKSLLTQAYSFSEATPKELHPTRMTHGFHPLIPGPYPTLNPTDLITFPSESDSSNLDHLLVRVKESSADIDQVIEEGMALRRQLLLADL